MSKTKKTITFQFPFKTSLLYHTTDISLNFVFLIPMLIIVLYRFFFWDFFNERYIPIYLLIGFISGAIIHLWMTYKRIKYKITEKILISSIVKNIPCPSCNSRISYAKKQYPHAIAFFEYYYICDLCRTENVVNVDENQKGWKTKYNLSKKRPLKMDIEDYEKFIERAENDEKLSEELKTIKAEYEDLINLNEEYRRKYVLPKQLEYDKKLRIFSYISLFIWIAIGLIIHYLYSKYGFLATIDFKYIFAILVFAFITTLVIYAYIEEKKQK